MKTEMNLIYQEGTGSNAKKRLLASITFFGSKIKLDLFIKTLEETQGEGWKWVIE